MSLAFCIEKTAIGTRDHFLWNGSSWVWVDAIPNDVYVFRHTPTPNDVGCLNTLLKLNGVEVSFGVPQQHINSFKSLMKSSFSFEDVMWQHALPPHVFKSCLTELTKKIQDTCKAVSTDYQKTVFSDTTRLFSSLEMAKIDTRRLDNHMSVEQSMSNRTTLESFRPVAGSFAKKTVYDRFGTRTGRLTVASGPEILTLKREYRDIIVSSYPGGTVFYVDYSALEARTFLSAVGRDVEKKDVYSAIAEKFFDGKFKRDEVKLAVLAFLYGATDETIQRTLKTTKAKTRSFLKNIETMFCVPELKAKLHKEWKESGGKIRNYYGRVINVPEETTLVNSFVQSTGVDVALLGFTNIVDYIANRKLQMRPLFILHDALLIDVHPSHFHIMDDVAKVGSVIPRMKNAFHMHCSRLVI